MLNSKFCQKNIQRNSFREEYVRAYVHYKLTASVLNQFQAFSEGFLRVSGGRVLEFFHPQELMEMVIGSQDYDFADLEKVRVTLVVVNGKSCKFTLQVLKLL